MLVSFNSHSSNRIRSFRQKSAMVLHSQSGTGIEVRLCGTFASVARASCCTGRAARRVPAHSATWGAAGRLETPPTLVPVAGAAALQHSLGRSACKMRRYIRRPPPPLATTTTKAQLAVRNARKLRARLMRIMFPSHGRRSANESHWSCCTRVCVAKLESSGRHFELQFIKELT